jgi:hypothetical protein
MFEDNPFRFLLALFPGKELDLELRELAKEI